MANLKADKNSTNTSAQIILWAQGVSIVASVAGFIGLVIAYRVLTKGGTSSSENTTRIPTIT